MEIILVYSLLKETQCMLFDFESISLYKSEPLHENNFWQMIYYSRAKVNSKLPFPLMLIYCVYFMKGAIKVVGQMVIKGIDSLKYSVEVILSLIRLGSKHLLYANFFLAHCKERWRIYCLIQECATFSKCEPISNTMKIWRA